MQRIKSTYKSAVGLSRRLKLAYLRAQEGLYKEKLGLSEDTFHSSIQEFDISKKRSILPSEERRNKREVFSDLFWANIPPHMQSLGHHSATKEDENCSPSKKSKFGSRKVHLVRQIVKKRRKG